MATKDWGIEKPEDEEELSPLLAQLLSALQGKQVDLSPRTRCLASLITQCIATRPTTTAINATITLHGITYRLLRDVWTMHDLKRYLLCPDEIAEGVPSIRIIDNDDFRSSTFKGGGTAYRFNRMFLQRIEYLAQKEDASTEDKRINDTKNVSLALTVKAAEMQTFMPYRTIKIGEPVIRPKPATFSLRRESHRKQSIIHALARLDVSDGSPDANKQATPSFNTFYVGLKVGKKYKAYNHPSYSQPPNKSVVKDVMDKLSTNIAIKHMPFAFLVGDLPVYVFITQLKAENPNEFQDIVPFLGPFHTQCVMMSAIYKR